MATTRSVRQVGSVFQNRLENLGSDQHGDQIAAARVSFHPQAAQTLPATGGELAPDQALTADAIGATGFHLMFGGATSFGATDANLSALGLNGVSADWGKLQFGLADLFVESQMNVAGLSGEARDAALAGFGSVNTLAPIVDGMVAIDAVATNGDGADLLAQLNALGFQGGVSFGGLVGGYIPLDAIDDLAGLDNLGFARPAYMMTNAGSVQSQDVSALNADYIQATNGLTGAGVKIGIMSDSFDTATSTAIHYATDQGTGDLPAGVNVILDYTPSSGSSTDEGRAMMQLAYDVAPGATYAFHTANGGQAVFAAGIAALQAAGAKVIVDDVFYYAEPMFQDGVVAQAVDTAVANGAMYFSSAGNQAQRSYQSSFADSGQTFTSGGITYRLHDFDPGAGVDSTMTVNQNAGSGQLVYDLQWDDPFKSTPGSLGASSDLALILRTTGGAVIGVIDSVNTNLDPVELAGLTGSGLLTVSIGVRTTSVNPGLVKLITFGGAFAFTEWGTNSSASFGHNNAVGAIAVAAADWFNTPAFGQTPPLGEYFTSRGGTPILFDDLGNRLAAPEYRSSVDFTAPDGGNTTFFSSDVAGDADSIPNFYGTSAAAPNAAAVAALLMQAFPTATRAQIETALKATALDITNNNTAINNHTLGVATGVGYDLDTGWGLIRADRAYAYLSELMANGNALLSPGQAQIIAVNTEDNGNPQRDSIDILLLAPLASGAKFYVTDRAWNGTVFAAASANEGTFTFTAAADLPAGTVIHISQAQLTAAGIDLSDAGETVYLYQGSTPDAGITFLHAVDIADGNTGFEGTELLNTGLVNGVSAVAIN
jgi:hypothetical protein